MCVKKDAEKILVLCPPNKIRGVEGRKMWWFHTTEKIVALTLLVIRYRMMSVWWTNNTE